MSKNSFLHISDLHFSRYSGSKSAKEEMSHFDIKLDIFKYLSKLIQERDIGAVLISGDLELDSPDDIIPYFKEWLELGSKIFIVFGEHDLKEKREELLLKTKGEKGIYIFNEPRMIQDPGIGFQVFGLSCESKQKGFNEQFNSINDLNVSIPTVFLTHPCNIAKEKMVKLGCQYYAVGHIHHKEISQISENIYLGRPGHIYSIWDGNGRAFPVGAILGKFEDGVLYSEWLPFPVPQTTRLYIDKFQRNEKNEILFNVENCPESKIKSLEAIFKGEWQNDQCRGIFKGFYSPDILPTENLVNNILKVFIDEIFVTPSDSYSMKKKYGFNRLCYSAKTLLANNDIFNEFVERSFKASSKTQ